MSLYSSRTNPKIVKNWKRTPLHMQGWDCINLILCYCSDRIPQKSYSLRVWNFCDWLITNLNPEILTRLNLQLKSFNVTISLKSRINFNFVHRSFNFNPEVWPWFNVPQVSPHLQFVLKSSNTNRSLALRKELSAVAPVAPGLSDMVRHDAYRYKKFMCADI